MALRSTLKPVSRNRPRHNFEAGQQADPNTLFFLKEAMRISIRTPNTAVPRPADSSKHVQIELTRSEEVKANTGRVICQLEPQAEHKT